jgi:hypothetical protein
MRLRKALATHGLHIATRGDDIEIIEVKGPGGQRRVFDVNGHAAIGGYAAFGRLPVEDRVMVVRVGTDLERHRHQRRV